MVHAAQARHLAHLLTIVVAAAAGLAVPAASAAAPPGWAAPGRAGPGQARPGPAGPGQAEAAPALSGLAPSRAPGLGAVARPPVTVPKPLPRRSGTVPLRAGLRVAPKPATSPERQVTAPGTPGDTPGTVAAGGSASAFAAGAGSVTLRALVLAVDADDFGVATWRATLDRVGAAYDVLHARTQPLDAATLVGPDGVGRYNAILLTNSTLLYAENGGYQSALTADEWNRLWAYERDYDVRQASLYTSYGTWPENYCLTGSSEGGVGDTPLNASLTPTGAGVFDYLKPGAVLPITQSYVYRTRIAAGCAAQPVLTAGDDVLAVRTTSTDGRERLALTFTSNQYLLQAHLLAYGVFRWASHGMHLGEQRHYLNVDIDDWFNSADHYFPDGHVESDPGYQVSGHDAYNLSQRQAALRAEHPAAAGFAFSLAFNGADADPNAGTACSPSGGIPTLTATSRCLAGEFRWLNHTKTHLELNHSDYPTTVEEIAGNRTIGTSLGLSSPINVLKTGEYSGLGVYNDNPDDDTSPPVDHGLAASNPNLIAAAHDLGVKYLHGNMSFASHLPACFNCVTPHPLDTTVLVVPDWPTNTAYHTTTPDEETAFYNSFYGPNGRFPYWPQNLTYEQILDYEAGLALSRMATGSVYTHTFHIANVRDYAAGKTLVTDWVDRVLDKYDAYYQVPVLSPEWPALGAYAEATNAHHAALAAGVTAVHDRVAGTVNVSSPQAATVRVSGVQTPNSQQYGTDVSAPVALAAAGTVSVTAAPRA